MVELGNGRVAFADTKAKLFLQADLQTGKVDTLGTRVDSLIANAPRRAVQVPGLGGAPGGRHGRTRGLQRPADHALERGGQAARRAADRGRRPGRRPVLVYDTIGNGYKVDYQAVLGGGEPGKIVRPDSVPVLRIGLKSGKVDTVANLASPEFGDAMFGEQVQQAVKVFAPNDFFGVLPNGTAWLARGHENRVDWRAPSGKWTTGTDARVCQEPVTQADRDRVLAQVREHGKQFGMPQDLPIEYPFADNKPPFDFALGRPNGEVWLQRPRAKEDAPVTTMCSTGRARGSGRWSFPPGHRWRGSGRRGRSTRRSRRRTARGRWGGLH